ncbi:MAG: hypothetical protein U5K28_08530 [Halobacteriales archaeon]|nr:hypothetical protein [Halobacteriales archaeon]
MGASAVEDEDDPFEEQREKAENPMRRLFLQYGRDKKVAFVVGALMSSPARSIWLPPILLGVAVRRYLRSPGRSRPAVHADVRPQRVDSGH